MKRIVLTGGGSAGHVTPNLALVPGLLERGYEVHYIGSVDGVERSLLADEPDINYHPIACGKLRRYKSLKNLSDPFRVIQGLGQARKLLKELRPHVVFSKGGYVAVPVVLAAASRKVPIVAHESDYTPGLANKIAQPYAKVLCTTFPETAEGRENAVYTGALLREKVFSGNRRRGLELLGFNGQKPVMLVMGGSLGAQAINEAVWEGFKRLKIRFDVVHLCGKGHLNPQMEGEAGYRQLEYADESLPDLFAAADLFVSRAGSNSIFELLALQKPNLLIPLPLSASRGDQLLNARSFEKRGFSKVLPQEELDEDTLYTATADLFENRVRYIEAMRREGYRNALASVLDIIDKNALPE